MITKDIVLKFLLQVTLGSEYQTIKTAKEQSDIILSCLSLGWNDAFSRTLHNVNKTAVTKDYKKNILKECGCIDFFEKYAMSTTPEEKVKILKDVIEKMNPYIRRIKKEDLTIGIVQKLFNIAVKLYTCIFMFKKELGIKLDLCAYNTDYADCPIDNGIMNSLEADKNFKENVNIVKKEAEKKNIPYLHYYPWSKINDENTYVFLQNEIRKSTNSPCALQYDFFKWKED